MSMYTTAQLLAANEQKFKFDPLFLRLFFRESYPCIDSLEVRKNREDIGLFGI